MAAKSSCGKVAITANSTAAISPFFKNKEIAEKLFISPTTVNFHINNLLLKTGYKNRVQLAVKARLEGLVIGDE